LSRLCSLDWLEVMALFTVSYSDPYPYYKCEPIQELASRFSIPVFTDCSMRSHATTELIRRMEPSLIIIGTYYEIIPLEVISIPPLGVINVHPSLLPSYRGPTPTFWAIMNGEKYTGITIHYIEDEKIDNGRSIYSQKVEIKPSDTDGELRYRIAENVGNVIEKALKIIQTNVDVALPELEKATSEYYPKNRNVYIDESKNYQFNERLFRALTPYPGAKILINDKTYSVKRMMKYDIDMTLGWENENVYVGKVEDEFVRYVVEPVID